MKIVVDKQGMEALRGLGEIAVRATGLKNAKAIVAIMDSCKLEKPLDLMGAIAENPGIQKELDAILESARAVEPSKEVEEAKEKKLKSEREMETTSATVKPLKNETTPKEAKPLNAVKEVPKEVKEVPKETDIGEEEK